MNEDEFIDAIAARFVAVGGMPDDKYTKQYARDVFEGEEITFGDPAHSWEQSDAWSIADTDMSYWED